MIENAISTISCTPSTLNFVCDVDGVHKHSSASCTKSTYPQSTSKFRTSLMTTNCKKNATISILEIVQLEDEELQEKRSYFQNGNSSTRRRGIASWFSYKGLLYNCRWWQVISHKAVQSWDADCTRIPNQVERIEKARRIASVSDMKQTKIDDENGRCSDA